MQVDEELDIFTGRQSHPSSVIHKCTYTNSVHRGTKGGGPMRGPWQLEPGDDDLCAVMLCHDAVTALRVGVGEEAQ